MTAIIQYTVEEVPGKGWIADAPELKAAAQGATPQEAVANLEALVLDPDVILVDVADLCDTVDALADMADPNNQGPPVTLAELDARIAQREEGDLYLPYEAEVDREAATWTVTGRDSEGQDFGVAAGKSLMAARARLKAWVLDSLLASAEDGEDRLSDLSVQMHISIGAPEKGTITLTAEDLEPIRARLAEREEQ